MPLPTISTLSTAPSTSDPATFAARSDTLFGTSMPNFVTEANALAAALNAGDYTAPDIGTWAVTLSDASGNNSSSTVTGRYIFGGADIGIALFPNLTNISTVGLTGGDEVRVSLPFSVAANYGALGHVAITSLGSLPGTGTMLMPRAGTGAAYANFVDSFTTGGQSVLLVSNLSNGVSDIFNFCLVYRRA